jgi:hypothetical protein
VWWDRRGKEVARARVLPKKQLALMANLTPLPDGNVLLVAGGGELWGVVECAFADEEVRKRDVTALAGEALTGWPTSAARMPNGHTLVAQGTARLAVEVDRAGKVVRRYPTAGRTWLVKFVR